MDLVHVDQPKIEPRVTLRSPSEPDLDEGNMIQTHPFTFTCLHLDSDLVFGSSALSYNRN